MPRISACWLSRRHRPVFPRRCIVCGRGPTDTTTFVVARDGRKGPAFWAGWYGVRVPSCPGCGWRLQAWRVWDAARTLAIAGSSLAFGLVYLLPRWPGWACGLAVLGLCVVGMAAVFVWNRVFPPAFAVDPHDGYVEFEFRDAAFHAEFLRLNNLSEPFVESTVCGAPPEGFDIDLT